MHVDVSDVGRNMSVSFVDSVFPQFYINTGVQEHLQFNFYNHTW